MSKEVLAAIRHSYDLGNYATPELRSMFHDWLSEIEQLVAEFVNQYRYVDLVDIARQFKLSKQSVIYIVRKLAQKDKISIQVGNGNNKIHFLKKSINT